MDKDAIYLNRRITELERRLEKVEAELLANRANPLNIGDYYTVNQLASALHVCDLTVRRKIQNGAITAVKVGKSWRIPKTELEKVFEE